MNDPRILNRPGSSTSGPASSSVPPSPRVSSGSRSSLRRELSLQQDTPQNQSVQGTVQSNPNSPSTQMVPASSDDRARAAAEQLSTGEVSHDPALCQLFALVTDTSHSTNTQTVHYPTLHYIFTDDDPEELTAALAQHRHRVTPIEGSNLEEGVRHDLLPSDGNISAVSKPQFIHRGVVLEMARPLARDASSSGSEHQSLGIAWASSLSADWAIVSTQLSGMGGIDATCGLTDGHNPVLHIEGVSLDATAEKLAGRESEMHVSSGSSGMQLPPTDQYTGFLDEFEKRMQLLKRVVDAGEERRRLVGTKDNLGAEEDTVGGENTAPVHNKFVREEGLQHESPNERSPGIITD